MGQFKGRDEVRWQDNSGLFVQYEELLKLEDDFVVKQCICPIYPNFREMFVTTGQVENEPGLEDFAKLLKLISKLISLPKALPHTLEIMSILGQVLCVDEPSQLAYNKSMLTGIKRKYLSDYPFLPIKGGTWATLSDGAMIADHKEYEKIFSKHKGVAFIDLGDSRKPDSFSELFLNVCGLS